jgi:ABC-type multidrug transport system fused ATPase/permease subunit
MPATPPPTPSAAGSLAGLGSGRTDDRLSLRLVLHIFVRTLPILRDVRGPLIWISVGFVGLALLGLPLAGIFIGSLWDGILSGKPLAASQAGLLGLDAASFVEVDSLGPEARRMVRTNWLIALAVVIGVLLPLGAGLAYAMVWLLQRINQVLRVQLLEQFQALSLRFHADSRVGDAIYRLYQDSSMVTAVINTLFLQPARFGFTFLLAIVTVTILDPLFGLLLAAAWLPSLWLGYRFSSPLRVSFRRAREANSDLTSRIQEVVAGIEVIKGYGAERAEQRAFEDASRQAFDEAFDARSRYALFGVAAFWIVGPVLLAGSARAAMLSSYEAETFAPTLAALLGLGALWTLGVFNFFKGRNGSGTQSIEWLFRNWGRAQDIAIGLDRVFEVLDLEPEIQDAPGAVPLSGLEHSIRFRDVAFSYEPGRPVLEDVNLEVGPGSITAIVGSTGSGKTTLLSLLLRLYEPDRGSIEIDGKDLRELQVASLRANVSIALQENILFDASVRENIRYAVPNASHEQVRAAAHVACADEFIEALPEGYDTPLGERGAKLSTGQRQRLSIARAVLKDTPILVLDEPTAALDAETELAVLERLSAWGAGRAILLITHRLSTIRRADRIVVLEDGRIREDGSHDELMRRPAGGYRGLVEHESGTAPVVGSPR